MENDNILEIRKVSKHFGGINALDEVDLELRRNEILGLVGDNGAGKSTLMKIITGAYQPDSGEIIFDGKPVHFRSPLESKQQGIEMVYQDLALCRNLDVSSNVFLGREKYRNILGFKVLNKKAMDEESFKIFSDIHINIPDIRRKAGNLSGGQQQAVAIGRSISFGPKMVILDEPTAALALKEVAKTLKLVDDCRCMGVSQIIISHRMEDIFQVSDRIMVLKNGKRVGVWNTKDVTQEEIVRYMFIGANQETVENGAF